MVRKMVGKEAVFGSVLLLASCAGIQPEQGGSESQVSPFSTTPVVTEGSTDSGGFSSTAETSSGAKEYVKYGSGKFVKKAAAKPQVTFVGGDITLNFEKTDIQEVVKVIIGDLLKENYLVGPGVSGAVSLQTSRPIGNEMLLPMLENLLRINGAVLAREGGMYRINALADAARGTLNSSIGAPQSVGYQVVVAPLRYIAATEMQKILQPLVPEGGLLLVDDNRNLLMLAGSSQELGSWTSMIDIFDVDWMRGYSVGFFPLQNTSAKVVAEDLNKVMLRQLEGGMGKMIRVEAIERLNALLVITPQAKYLNQVKGWIARLDTVGSEPGRRLYVYQVKNRKAVELASVVNEVFGGTSSQRSNAPSLVTAGDVQSPDGKEKKSGAGDKTESTPRKAPSSASEGLVLPEGSDIRIVADSQNNAILVMATGVEYRIVEAAIRKLDVLPLQVLVEASIMEITLSDELSYGLEWYLSNRDLGNDFSGSALLDLNAGEGIDPIIPGFSYAVVNAANDVNVILNALATESRLNMLSSPSLMVLDNSKAYIRVGEQVPVRSSGERALGEQTIYETFEYKDTGVMLSVTPRVNSGGLVTMEIDQTITDIGAVESTTQQRKFLQRNIKSEVAVQSGQTIVLGGLILENNTDDRSGIPLLRDIPFIGWLFGGKQTIEKRTELLVLITPQVVRSQHDAGAITEEFKLRMEELQPTSNGSQEVPVAPVTSGDQVVG